MSLSWTPCPCKTNGFEGLFSVMPPVMLPPGVLPNKDDNKELTFPCNIVDNVEKPQHGNLGQTSKIQECPFITYSKRNVLPPELWADPGGKEPVPSGCKNLQLFPLKHPLGVPKNLQNRCLSCSFTSLQSHKHIFLMNENNLHLCIGEERKHVCFLCLSLPHVAKHSIINFCHIPLF